LRNISVSVIVPVFNAGPYVGKCLDSILSQEGVPFEVVCVDGGGGDGSIETVERYAAGDRKIRIVRQPENLGPGGNRNRGVENAEGEYITCVDADDWLMPEALASAYAAARKNRTDSVCFKHVCYLEADNSYAIEAGLVKYHALSSGVLENSLFSVPVMSWGKLLRTDAIRCGGIIWPATFSYEDCGFHFKFFALYPRTWILDRRLYVYRRRKHSLSANFGSKSWNPHDLLEVVRDILIFLEYHGLQERLRPVYHDFIGRMYEPYLYLSTCKETAIRDLKAILTETAFPENNGDCRYSCLFKAVQAYEGRPWWSFAYAILTPLLSLIPMTNRRRCWRYWLKVFCMAQKKMKSPAYIPMVWEGV
jgi:glycosyltransferase involved in cell wall biosynthesis